MIKTKKEKSKDMNKGITLIALVITIIVLLILAAVSIATLTGENGILTRANDAKTSTEIAEEKEKIELATVAALADDNGGEIKENYLKQELEKYFGTDGVSVTPGENNGEDGFIVTIDDSGRQYFVDKDGNVSEMIPGPTVTYSINPETQVGDGEKITITINATATEGEITKITKPDGSTVENATTATYEVEENGDYVFTVEQSNGGKTVYTVTITNGKNVEKFSDIYGSTTEYSKNGQTAWIPEGFAVGVSSTIDEISEGLVITDAIDSDHKSIGNEFVWIPATVDEMAKATTGRDSNSNQNYQGKLYDFPSATESKEKTSYGQGTTSYREPDTVSSYDNNSTYLDIIKGILKDKADYNADDYASIGNFKTTMQEDYNAMIKSVEKYGGFYIGRYEMSKSSSNNAQSKKNSIALTAAEDSANRWYGLYAYGKTYTNATNSVVSNMVWGSQYDAMMRWMQKNNENVTSTTVPNGGSKNKNITITGPEGDTDIIRNVYDLYGGRLEWTLEAYNTNIRVSRGRFLQQQHVTEWSQLRQSIRYEQLLFFPPHTLC